MHMVLWSPVGAPAGVPGPRRNADECDAGWFAPVATRRRPLLADFSVGFAMARGIFPGGHPRTPCRPLLAAAPPPGLHPGARCALRRPRAWLVAPPRVGGRGRVALPSAVPRSPAVRRGPSWGRGGRGGGRLRWPLRPWRRIFASDAVVTPHVRFGTGSGAASPFLTFAVAAKLGSGPPRDGRSRSCPARGAVPVAGATGAPHPRPVRPLFTSRTLVTLRLRHAAISGAGVTVRGRESYPGALACPLFPAGM